MNFTNADNVQTVTMEASAAVNQLTLNNVKNTAGTHALNYRGDGLNAANELYDTLVYVAGDATGSGSTLAINVHNRGVVLTDGTYSHQPGAFTANGFESVSITVADGDCTFATGSGSTELQSLSLTASHDLTLGTVTGGDSPAANKSVTSINASNVAGNLSATFHDVGDFASVTLGGGADIVSIGEGNSAGANASLYGGAGNDVLTGTNQADFIYGEAGNDQITGDGGGDTIAGGAGSDTFIIAVAADGGDTYSDFDWGGGANNDNLDFQVAALSIDGTVTDFAGATVTALPADTAMATNAVIFQCAEQIAASTAATAVANAVTQLADGGTDVASAVGLAANDSFLFIMNDGTNYFIFHYLASAAGGGIAVTDANDLTLLGVFSGLDGANAAAADFL